MLNDVNILILIFDVNILSFVMIKQFVWCAGKCSRLKN